jgi:hypothetical protein
MRYPEIKTKLSALVVKTVEVAEVDNNDNPISEHQCESVAKPARGWGGPRPGSGAPKGNLNAFKHGRNSRRQAQLLEALLEIPEARQALIDLGKRNRRRRKQAEEGAGVLMTALLEKVAAIVLQSPVSQGRGVRGVGCNGRGVRGEGKQPWSKQPGFSRLPEPGHRPNSHTSRKTTKNKGHLNQEAAPNLEPPRRGVL